MSVGGSLSDKTTTVKKEDEMDTKNRISINEGEQNSVIYADYILSFNQMLQTGLTQAVFAQCQAVKASEQEQFLSMMESVKSYCIENNLPYQYLCKISIGCDTKLFRKLTGDEAKFLSAINGKLYFGNGRNDLNAVEEWLMTKFGFGNHVFFDDELMPLNQIENEAQSCS